MTLRWWRNASVTFFVLTPVMVPFLVAGVLAALLGGKLPPPLVMVGLLVVVPALVATGIEAASRPEPPLHGRRLALRALIIVAGFAFWPASLVGWLFAGDAITQWRRERPIVASSRPGFCAPLRYGVRDSLPWIEITTRLPRPGRYGWYVQASDGDSAQCWGTADSVLSAGVHAVVITIRPRDPGGRLTWPVRVRSVLVSPLWQAAPVWSDCRLGRFLPVIRGPKVP